MTQAEALRALDKAINAEHSQANMDAVQLARDTVINALPKLVAMLEAQHNEIESWRLEQADRIIGLSNAVDGARRELTEALDA